MTAPQRRTLEDVVTVLREWIAQSYPGRRAVRLAVDLDDGEPIRLPVPAPEAAEPALRYTPDGRTVWLSGQQYDFTDDQAAAALLLARALESGVRDVANAELLEASESGCARVRDLFRSSTAWADRLIVRGQRANTYRLLWPSEVED